MPDIILTRSESVFHAHPSPPVNTEFSRVKSLSDLPSSSLYEQANEPQPPRENTHAFLQERERSKLTAGSLSVPFVVVITGSSSPSLVAMDVRDKLTLAHPPTTLSKSSSVITPSALPVVAPFRNFAVAPTVSPASRFTTTSTTTTTTTTTMQQQYISENSSEFINVGDDAKDKAALSFILSSSDSESDTESSNAKMRTGANVVKRKRTVTRTTSEAAAPVRKGSKFCTVEGCTSRAKHAKRCWKHGGSVKCKVPDCINRAKSKGVCWSHGGGTVCSFENCDTIAVSNGFCWAHGGGKRCQVPNCSKPAYERTQNYCQTHFQELGAAAESGSI